MLAYSASTTVDARGIRMQIPDDELTLDAAALEREARGFCFVASGEEPDP